jgi:hypothetical protein
VAAAIHPAVGGPRVAHRVVGARLAVDLLVAAIHPAVRRPVADHQAADLLVVRLVVGAHPVAVHPVAAAIHLAVAVLPVLLQAAAVTVPPVVMVPPAVLLLPVGTAPLAGAVTLLRSTARPVERRLTVAGSRRRRTSLVRLLPAAAGPGSKPPRRSGSVGAR